MWYVHLLRTVGSVALLTSFLISLSFEEVFIDKARVCYSVDKAVWL